MISASEIHELRFEKAAFGYKQEDIDEFLNRLEVEVESAQQELEDSNGKIQVLADKVREYMQDEDALKDALFGAQKERHRIIADANDKADEIIAKAKEKADAIMDEVTVQHDALMEKNEAEIEAMHQKLDAARKQVADFKKALFDMYKDHLNMISAMPDADDDTFGIGTPEETPSSSDSDTFSTSSFSAKAIQGAYDSRFGDSKDSSKSA